MTFKYVKTVKKDTGMSDISLLMYIGASQHQSTVYNDLIWGGLSSILLLAYLGYFSVLKFRRVRIEAE